MAESNFDLHTYLEYSVKRQVEILVGSQRVSPHKNVEFVPPLRHANAGCWNKRIAAYKKSRFL